MDAVVGVKAGRAVIIVVAFLATTSVVAWPIAVALLPLLFWAATGGRIARWSASTVAASAILIAALTALWYGNGWTTEPGAPVGWWLAALTLSIFAPALVAFAWLSSTVHHRRTSARSSGPVPEQGARLVRR